MFYIFLYFDQLIFSQKCSALFIHQKTGFRSFYLFLFLFNIYILNVPRPANITYFVTFVTFRRNQCQRDNGLPRLGVTSSLYLPVMGEVMCSMLLDSTLRVAV